MNLFDMEQDVGEDWKFVGSTEEEKAVIDSLCVSWLGVKRQLTLMSAAANPDILGSPTFQKGLPGQNEIKSTKTHQKKYNRLRSMRKSASPK